jgi:hypothetical protein
MSTKCINVLDLENGPADIKYGSPMTVSRKSYNALIHNQNFVILLSYDGIIYCTLNDFTKIWVLDEVKLYPMDKYRHLRGQEEISTTMTSFQGVYKNKLLFQTKAINYTFYKFRREKEAPDFIDVVGEDPENITISWNCDQEFLTVLDLGDIMKIKSENLKIESSMITGDTAIPQYQGNGCIGQIQVTHATSDEFCKPYSLILDENGNYIILGNNSVLGHSIMVYHKATDKLKHLNFIKSNHGLTWITLQGWAYQTLKAMRNGAVEMILSWSSLQESFEKFNVLFHRLGNTGDHDSQRSFLGCTWDFVAVEIQGDQQRFSDPDLIFHAFDTGLDHIVVDKNLKNIIDMLQLNSETLGLLLSNRRVIYLFNTDLMTTTSKIATEHKIVDFINIEESKLAIYMNDSVYLINWLTKSTINIIANPLFENFKEFVSACSQIIYFTVLKEEIVRRNNRESYQVKMQLASIEEFGSRAKEIIQITKDELITFPSIFKRKPGTDDFYYLDMMECNMLKQIHLGPNMSVTKTELVKQVLRKYKYDQDISATSMDTVVSDVLSVL